MRLENTHFDIGRNDLQNLELRRFLIVLVSQPVTGLRKYRLFSGRGERPARCYTVVYSGRPPRSPTTRRARRNRE